MQTLLGGQALQLLAQPKPDPAVADEAPGRKGVILD